MPDTRRHRGPHPKDAELFRDTVVPVLNEAVAHLSWLLSHGYAIPSALKLVGDRFHLTERQRRAVLRSSCSDQQRTRRRAHCRGWRRLAGAAICADGFNVITTVEAALAGGVVLACRDGCYRDMASMHGQYRSVEETIPALEYIGRTLQSAHVAGCHWVLDRPVSNSGRLAVCLRDLARSHGWQWTVQLAARPDKLLAESTQVVATADGPILDRVGAWCNLARRVVRRYVKDAWVVRLTGD